MPRKGFDKVISANELLHCNMTASYWSLGCRLLINTAMSHEPIAIMLRTIVCSGALLCLMTPALADAQRIEAAQWTAIPTSSFSAVVAAQRFDRPGFAGLGVANVPEMRPTAASIAPANASIGNTVAADATMITELENVISPDLEAYALALAFLGLIGLIARRCTAA